MFPIFYILSEFFSKGKKYKKDMKLLKILFLLNTERNESSPLNTNHKPNQKILIKQLSKK